MAKKQIVPENNAATPPTTPDEGAAKAPAKKVGRPAGFSTKDNDVFKSELPQPDVKMAPQALQIAKIVEASGNKGITRGELVKQMDGIVTTRQPQGRILSYYQKALVEAKFFTITEGAPAVAAPEAPAEA